MGPKASSRKTSLKSKLYNDNISKRGYVTKKVTEKEGPAINPYVLMFFFFLVVGSSLFQIIKNATSGPLL